MDVADIVMGQAPPGDTVSDDGPGVPFLQGNAEFGSMYPVSQLVCRQPTRLCCKGDSLISVRAPVGALNIADRRYAIGRGLAAIRFRAIDEKYGRHCLPLAVKQLHRVAQGTTFAAVGRRELATLTFDAPLDIREQQRLAEILDAVDNEINDTQKVIAKLKRVSSGLLSDLLSRMDSPARPLDGFLTGRPRNGFSPNEIESWSGVLALGLGCLTAEGFIPRQLKNVPAKDARYASAWLSVGDLLISRSNTYDLVGLVGRYRDVGAPCVYPDLMMKLTPNALVRPDFLELVLRNADAREQIKRISQGTSGSMVKISGASLLKIQVKIPDLVEQDRILKISATQTVQRYALERESAKLLLVKQGLMEDLLTGRVRVSDL
jgi:type I restriction enzyme S subunit